MTRREARFESMRDRQDAYLAAREERGTFTGACKATHTHYHTVYKWRDEDQPDGYTAEEFLRLEKQAIDCFADRLEGEAIRRGVEGIKRAKYHQGQIVGYEQEYSDTMLAMLLNGARPEKYQRQRVEHTGKDGGPVQHEHIILPAAEVRRRLQEAGIEPATPLLPLVGDRTP